MRHTILIIAFLLAAALAAGCTNDANAAIAPLSPGSEVAASPTPSEVAAVKLDKAEAETLEAARAAQEFAYARKAEFVDTMKKELVAIQVELDRTAAKIDKSNAAQKAEAKVKLAAMREQWIRTSEQLDMAQNANEKTWDAMRAGFDKSFGDLKDAVDGTRQWLSDKIEP